MDLLGHATLIIPTGTHITYQRDFDPAPKRGRVTASWDGGVLVIPDDAWQCDNPRCQTLNPLTDYVHERYVIHE